jgi:hypothetical protein
MLVSRSRATCLWSHTSPPRTSNDVQYDKDLGDWSGPSVREQGELPGRYDTQAEAHDAARVFGGTKRRR